MYYCTIGTGVAPYVRVFDTYEFPVNAPASSVSFLDSLTALCFNAQRNTIYVTNVAGIQAVNLTSGLAYPIVTKTGGFSGEGNYFQICKNFFKTRNFFF